jgi:ATP phosphoribosyltransferase
MPRDDIRLALPSKGRIAEDALAFLAACGLPVYRPNPRQYAATIPTLPGLTVMFQRPGDIAVSVVQGSVDFGITGRDVFFERCGTEEAAVLMLHDALGFSPCRLCLAVPESWAEVNHLAGLRAYITTQSRPVRVATKFPRLTGQFLEDEQLTPYELVLVEGTLEIAPVIGYADLIADLVSTGTTLRDNHLKPLADGVILHSEAILIANRESLRARPEVLNMARELIEYVEAHLRAQECFAIFANMRGETPEEIAQRMFTAPHLSGLQGPTISPIVPNPVTENGAGWYAVHIVVRKAQLSKTIAELRAVGGSGVVVSPVTYIFEEEPERYQQMVAALKG